MTPIGKVFDILELTTLIADDLSQHDLALCCCVSKSFFNIFSPHLWHFITIHPNDPILKFQSPEGRAGLLRNGHHIRVLRAYGLFALEPFVESGSTCTNLVSLDVNHSVDRFTGKVTVTRTFEMLSRGRRGSIGAGQRQISRVMVFPFSHYAESKRVSETTLISILKRNLRLEFLIVPSYCLDCEAIAKVAGESLLFLKEFYSDNDLKLQRHTINFSLRENFRKTQA
ncbi:hypothetical protein BG015_001913 [Linnemannia schmuckeri]|uniref:F-box domain-containing protein n=1 Tax=Linnemannia schmuckeri TaxID=64567 RepID=A0A9P5RP58_9FUNG|nr:hypothetical protein BG015_001913 [Linnemannia schmuckeri]